MPYSFERTSDLKLARYILTRPEVYFRLGDDSKAPRERVVLEPNPSIEYVLVKDGDEVIGLVLVIRRNAICCECHVCMLPESWGRRAWAAASLFLPWLWTNTSFSRSIGYITASNRLALRYASQCGFHVWGLNEKAVLKNGKLLDEIWVGATRPETT